MRVIVVGAGIVGLATALGLLKRGITVDLIEYQSTPNQQLPQPLDPFDTRVVAITRASEQLFQSLGVWPIISRSRCCDYQRMRVWDKAADGEIQFSADEYYEPNLGHMIEQQVIKGALWQGLSFFNDLHCHFGRSVVAIEQQSDQVTVTLDQGERLNGKLLIIADGGGSPTRSLLGIEVKKHDYQQSAIVATVQGEKPHQKTAFQRFATEGPLALLPLSEPNTCSIVWTTDPNAAQMLCQQKEKMGTILTREIDAVMGRMQLLSDPIMFPLIAQAAKTYAKGRSVLIGDSAHTIHPLAGQGVNLGLKDVAYLLDLIDEASAKGRDIGAANLLARYSRRRQSDNQIMSHLMTAFKVGFGSRQPWLQLVRNVGLNWVNEKPLIKQFFVKKAFGTT